MEAVGDDYRHKGMRRQLVEHLQRRGIIDERVLDALGRVPRHLFLDDSALIHLAYADQA